MRYIKEELFQCPVEVKISDTDKGIEEHPATVGDVLLMTLRAYAPTGERDRLDVGALRKLNKVIDVLEAGPQESGYFALEDEEYNMAKRVAAMMAPQLLRFARNAPALEDTLEQAHKGELPKNAEEVPEPEPSPDGTEGAIKTKAEKG